MSAMKTQCDFKNLMQPNNKRLHEIILAGTKTFHIPRSAREWSSRLKIGCLMFIVHRGNDSKSHNNTK